MKIFSELLQKLSSNQKSNVNIHDFESFDDLILGTCILLIEVSKADDSFDEVEKDKIVDILKKNFSLESDQTKILIKLADEKNQEMISLYEWTSEMNKNYSYSEKVNVIKVLWDVAYADGHIDKYEDYTIRKISELLYVKHQDFIKAKLR
tara:strand:+ start:2529 stop:2978 length:450 start_codon:yes stop_codon:yes gene_type:complete